ncbi:MAG TPA: mechanosensitive ion channel domain-containing protein [Gemmatimonadales bacterium]|nr:mechanosensitive ion channel domain-containing protein [Gemmatimonadales bacterium]
MRIPLRTGLVLAGWLVAAPLAAQDSARPAPPSAAAAPVGRPVVLGRDTVLTLYASQPPYSLEQRTLAVTGMLAEVAGRADLRLDSLQVVPQADGAFIMADSVALLAVLDGDALAAGVPRDTLAARWVASLEAAFSRRSARYHARDLALGIAEALIATLVFVFLLRLVLGAEDRLEAWLRRWAEARLDHGPLAKARLITPAQIASAVLSATSLVRVITLLTLAYLWLVAVFGAFALTRPLAGRIMRFVTEPIVALARGLVGYLPSLFFIIVVLAALRLLVRAIHVVFRGIEQGTLKLRKFPAEWADPTYKIVRALVFAFGFILIFPYLPGAGSEAFNAISLFAGALFSLGSTGAVANIVAGVVIVYTRAFRVGEFVRIGETEGMVVERSLLVTRIRTATNIEVSIPSATVLNSHVQNFSAMAQQGGLVVQSRVTIGYDAPWRQVHELLLAAAGRTEGVLAAPAPFVVQEALNDYYPTYCLNAYTGHTTAMEVFRLRSSLNEAIQDAFFEGGVEILSPAFTAIRDGNRTAMPPQYLPPDYRAPGWKVERGDGRA